MKKQKCKKNSTRVSYFSKMKASSVENPSLPRNQGNLYSTRKPNAAKPAPTDPHQQVLNTIRGIYWHDLYHWHLSCTTCIIQHHFCIIQHHSCIIGIIAHHWHHYASLRIIGIIAHHYASFASFCIMRALRRFTLVVIIIPCFEWSELHHLRLMKHQIRSSLSVTFLLVDSILQ